MAPKQDNRECAMTRNARSGSINHVSQVDTGKELLNQLLAEFALHERIGGDHANIAGRLCFITIDSQVKEAFSERHSERVLAMTGRVALPVFLVQSSILNRDVRRIPYHHVVLLPQNAVN